MEMKISLKNMLGLKVIHSKGNKSESLQGGEELKITSVLKLLGQTRNSASSII